MPDAELPNLSRRADIIGMVQPLPQYTIEDLASFPDDGQRYELLEGLLLVKPAPGLPHQLVAARLQAELNRYLKGVANVVGPGVVERPPKTHLEPDLLVFPAPIPKSLEWNDLAGHWLAVEVMSRGSRRYDQDYKRNAYLALGVREVWLIDWRAREVLRSTADGIRDLPCQGRLRWHPSEIMQALEIDLGEVFAEL